MTLFVGICAGDTEKAERIALPAIHLAAPGAVVSLRRNQKAILEAYNSLLEEASSIPDLELVLLIHDDVELGGPDDVAAIRAALADRRVGLVGAVGGKGGGGMSWWSRQERFGHVREPHNVYALSPECRYPVEVDVVDGCLLAIAPDLARQLRFERRGYPGFHGYDAEISSSVRSLDRAVVVAWLNLTHHTAGAFGNAASYEAWVRANLTWRLRWQSMGKRQRLWLRVRRSACPVEVRVHPHHRKRLRGFRKGPLR